MNEPYTETVPIADIVIPKGRRRIDDANVKTIADSIKAEGLLQPIALTADYKLIFGLHRIEAKKLLKQKTIEARIYAVSASEAELMEITENICRHALDALDYSKALARMKALYLEVHPETAPGIAGGKASGESRKTEERTTADSAVVQPQPAKSFASDTAEKTGKAERTIREDVAIGEAIPDDVAKTLAGTDVADNKSQLKQLAALPKAKQRDAAKKIASGKAETVAEATGTKPAKKQPGPKGKALKALGDLTRRLDDCDLYDSPCCKQGCTFSTAVARMKETLGAKK
jgi:ParB family chromosome partitioning protein